MLLLLVVVGVGPQTTFQEVTVIEAVVEVLVAIAVQ
jgi:hypothetical protein